MSRLRPDVLPLDIEMSISESSLIACEKTFLLIKTVETRRSKIYAKLGFESRADLMHYAIKHHILCVQHRDNPVIVGLLVTADPTESVRPFTPLVLCYIHRANEDETFPQLKDSSSAVKCHEN